MRIPTPLLLNLEFVYKLYFGEKKSGSPEESVFSLRSERKVKVVFKVNIEAIFLNCFSQLVEMFSELQFWALILI
jgi:hypothetical protein